ncbi:hypothetical protein DFJ73DRAFT_833003 [Zopfochytrium polystomum]|nr:hypothetical protein DFJ73DRAFT_833003 [Zopfochytrium polystomum]
MLAAITLIGRKNFSLGDIPDLSGKFMIVTGASSGIGKFSAWKLAEHGAHVVLACRSLPKADAAIAEIKSKCPNAKVEAMQLDLSSLASVLAFAQCYLQKGYPIDVLLNNAGVMAPSTYTESADGLEVQLATNLLGPMFLTSLLLPAIKKTASANGSARIVNVSSIVHKTVRKGGINLDKANDKTSYSPYYRYAETKLGVIQLTRELQRRIDVSGVDNVFVNTLHPGEIATEIIRPAAFIGPLTDAAKLFLMDVHQGALTQLFLSTSPKILENGYKGQYFVPIANLGTPSEDATNQELACALWEWGKSIIAEKGFGTL